MNVLDMMGLEMNLYGRVGIAPVEEKIVGAVEEDLQSRIPLRIVS